MHFDPTGARVRGLNKGSFVEFWEALARRVPMCRAGRNFADELTRARVRDLQWQVMNLQEEPRSQKTPLTVGQKIHKFRKQCGWSQEKLAYETGLSRYSIIDHERDTTAPTPDTLARYRDAFNKKLAIGLTATLDLLST